MGKLMKSKLVVLAVSLTLVTILGIAGCLSAPTPGEPAPQEPLKIGFSIALTGWGAMYEEAIHDMALAHEDEVNETGGIHGRPIELIVYDNESTSELAVLHTKKFIEEDEVLVIISELFSGPAWAQIEVAKDAGVPFIIQVGGPEPEELFIPGTYIFGNHPPYDYFAESTITYLVEDLGLTEIAFLATSDESGEEDLVWALEALESFGIEPLIVERCDPEAIDVTAQLTRIKAENPEAIQLAGSGVVVGPMMKGIKLLGLDIPIAGVTGMVSEEAFVLIEGYEPELLIMPCMPTQTGAFPGLLPADHPISITIDEMWSVWYEDYGETKGTKADMCMGWGFFGWGTMELACEALRQADPDLLLGDLATARDAVRWSMENEIIGFETTWGTRTITPTNHVGLAKQAPALLTIEDGEVVLLKLLQ